MRDESEIESMLDAILAYHDQVTKSHEDAWKLRYLDNYIGILDWVLGDREDEDMFDEEILELRE